MLKRAKTVLEGFYFSLPIQLVVFQVRHNKSILVWWMVLFLIVNNSLGSGFGIPYLFLEPEYLGSTNFWSMLLIGAGLAAFIASYHIAMYILDSYRFPFLAMEDHPFHVFYVNNSLIPGLFLLFYTERFIAFQIYILGRFDSSILLNVAGLYTGIAVMFALIAAYFLFTNQNIFKVFGKAIAHEIRRPRAIIDKARSSMASRNRVDFFFSGWMRLSKVDKSLPADLRSLVRVLNQNHGNALFLELILLIAILILGLGEDRPLFQIPAGASLMLTFSVIMMFIGAFTFWFRKIGPLSFIVLAIAFFGLDKAGFFDGRHQALGMDYNTKAAPYTAEHLERTNSASMIAEDTRQTLRILEQWKNDYQAFHGRDRKPKAVFLCVSGGGLRSAYFTFRSLQILDSLTNGEFFDHTRLITGASGGMVGASYFRELEWRRKTGREKNITDKKYALQVARDLLNRISFKMVSGLFLPHLMGRVGDREYASDRGYSFDEQMMDNLPEFRDRKLGEYAQPEAEALIPMMVLSPVVVNDGRKLFISASPVSYLARTVDPKEGIGIGNTGIEFRRFFRDQDPDNLLFVTALRMNATFPGITPNISLPSDPPLKTIDAGVADNFGTTTAIRFLYVFRDWFARNTDGVLILQIRDTERLPVGKYGQEKSFLNRVGNPLGAFYESYTLSRDFNNEDFLNYSGALFEGHLEFASIEYIPDESGERASLSWHLTDREQMYLDRSTQLKKNQKLYHYVADWLRTPADPSAGHIRVTAQDSVAGK